MQLARFVYLISPGGSERKLIDQLGLRGSAIAHDRELGTACVDYTFDNATLTVMWQESPVADQSPWNALWMRDRLRWPEHAGSPFIVQLENETPIALSGMESQLAGRKAWIADNHARLDEPLVLCWTGSDRIAHAGQGQREIGIRDISKIRLRLPRPPSNALSTALALPQFEISVEAASEAHAMIEFDGARRGQIIDLAPLLPIGFAV